MDKNSYISRYISVCYQSTLPEHSTGGFVVYSVHIQTCICIWCTALADPRTKANLVNGLALGTSGLGTLLPCPTQL